MKSLRYRLMVALLVGLMVGGAIGAAGIFWQSLDELNEQFDDRLRSICLNLRPESLARDPQIRDMEASDDIVVQLWSRDGELLFHSKEEDRAPIPTTSGFTTEHSSASSWRSYARRTSNAGYLQVAQKLSARNEIAASSAFQFVLPLLAILPLLALFTVWVVSRQLRPLRALAEQLQMRGALSRNVISLDRQAPTELMPVVGALNDLLARQADAARKQQAFLADAAHELRTPLAVVSLQLQRAQTSVTDGERQEALDALKRGVERTSRMVAQLLDLARSEQPAEESTHLAPVPFDHLVKAALAELHPLAMNKRIDLGMVESCSCAVFGDAENLRSVVINLVDNAIRFSPAGSRVDISLQCVEHMVELSVADMGPGIAAAHREHVFERFARADVANVGGTGLGLAIVRQVVLRHGGSITLDDGIDGRGLAVRIRLPIGA